MKAVILTTRNVGGSVSSVKEQSPKAQVSMTSTALPQVMSDRELHIKKAPSGTVCRPSGMTTDVRWLQLWKQPSPIVSSVAGMPTRVSDVQ